MINHLDVIRLLQKTFRYEFDRSIMNEHDLRKVLKDEEYDYEHGELSVDDETVYYIRLQTIEQLVADTVRGYANLKKLKHVPTKAINSIWTLLTGKYQY